MITISLCMIVKNEEAVLARCLDSIKDVADEIIIVDTGSADQTKAIAGKYTDKIFDFEWVDDFSTARNYAFSKATMDYQMWLDADDVVPIESVEKLLELKETLDKNVDMVTMKYLTHFDEGGNPIFISTRERLTKREKEYKWHDPVHECIPLAGEIFYSDIEIHHRKTKQEGVSYRNLNIYTELEKQNHAFTPRQQYYFARELKDHKMWEKAAKYFELFLNGDGGWVEDNIAACYSLAICYSMLQCNEKVLPAFLKSFEYDAPRSEICCEIGYYYKGQKNYTTALKWFRTATACANPDSIGFILKDYHGYIPNIESCVCAYQLGENEAAKQFNENAALYKQTEEVEANRKFFENL